MRVALVVVVGLLLAPRAAEAQPIGRPAGVVRPAVSFRLSAPAPSAPRSINVVAELDAASPYIGWGMAVGTVIGFAYGLHEANAIKVPGVGVAPLLLDTVGGCVIGMLGGAAVYVTRRATGRNRPTA